MVSIITPFFCDPVSLSLSSQQVSCVTIMSKVNGSTVTEFILLGFSDHPELQVPLFMVFLVIYLITLVGNLGMIMLIRVDSCLHTPMYFFLCNLSFIDICSSSSITSKMLSDLLAERKGISFAGCATQAYFYNVFGTTQGFLLAMMA
ncbi:unnamed protein product [Natator depressus]